MTKSECARCGSPLAAGQDCPRCVGRLLLEAAEPVDAQLNEYELGAEMGRGAMGVVYRARQARLRREVAVKVILASQFAGESARKRFLAEAELAAQLDHPNIVPIYEVGETEDGPFYAMKLVEGGTLAERLSAFKDRPEDASRVVAKIARAIHHAHQRGVLHRDLKPGNILIDAQGEPHVTDFGLARQLGTDSSLTLYGSTLGTPAYMSPEQSAGKPGITTAADVWSLGAILFHLLTGRPPFNGSNAADILVKLRTEEAPRLRTLNAKLPRDLETVCLKCLEKDPTHRYGSASELADELDRFLKHEPIRAKPSTAAERLVKWTRRHPLRAGFSLAFLLVLLAGIAGIAWQWRRAEAALDQSQRSLWQANFDRARALRTSRQMGQRVEALKAIRAAAALRPTPELRAEAIATLALPDFEDVDSWHSLPNAHRGFALDGNFERVAVGLNSGELEIYQFGAAQPGVVLTNGATPVRPILSKTGARLAALDSQRCRVWDVARRDVLLELSGVVNLEFSPDGEQLAFSTGDGEVIVHDFSAPKVIGRLPRGRSPTGVLFSPDGKRVAAYRENTLQILDVASGAVQAERKLPGHAMNVSWNADATILAIGSDDSFLYCWDIRRNKLQKLAGHLREGVMAWFHPRADLVVSTSWDEVLRLWDPFAARQLLETPSVRPMGFSSDGQWLLVRGGRGMGRMRVHLPREMRLLQAPLAYDHLLSSLAFSPDSHFIAANSANDIFAWHLESGRLRARQGLRGVTSVEFMDRHTVLTASSDGVMLWTNTAAGEDWQFGSGVMQVPAGKSVVDGATLSSDRRRVAVKIDGRAVIYTLPAWERQFELRGQAMFDAAQFSSDNRWMASGHWHNGGGRGPGMWIWSGVDGQVLRKMPMGNAIARFSGDGRWFLVAEDKRYQLMAIEGQPANWKQVWQAPRETGAFTSGAAAFSPDSSLVAVQADRRIVRLVESASGRELARLTPLSVGIGSLVWSADGRWLATHSQMGIQIWDLVTLRTSLREIGLDWDGPATLARD